MKQHHHAGRHYADDAVVPEDAILKDQLEWNRKGNVK